MSGTTDVSVDVDADFNVNVVMNTNNDSGFTSLSNFGGT